MSQSWNSGGDGQQGAQFPQYGPGTTGPDPYPAPDAPYGRGGSGYQGEYRTSQPAGYYPNLRPGSVTATAVLAYVEAAMVLFGAIIAFAGGQILTDSVFSDSTRGTGTFMVVLGILGLLDGGLLIAGGVQVAAGRPLVVQIANAGALLLCLGWLLLILQPDNANGSAVIWPVWFAVMPIVGLSVLATGPARQWLASRR